MILVENRRLFFSSAFYGRYLNPKPEQRNSRTFPEGLELSKVILSLSRWDLMKLRNWRSDFKKARKFSIRAKYLRVPVLKRSPKVKDCLIFSWSLLRYPWQMSMTEWVKNRPQKVKDCQILRVSYAVHDKCPWLNGWPELTGTFRGLKSPPLLPTSGGFAPRPEATSGSGRTDKKCVSYRQRRRRSCKSLWRHSWGTPEMKEDMKFLIDCSGVSLGHRV